MANYRFDVRPSGTFYLVTASEDGVNLGNLQLASDPLGFYTGEGVTFGYLGGLRFRGTLHRLAISPLGACIPNPCQASQDCIDMPEDKAGYR